MTDPNVYPQTAELEKFVDGLNIKSSDYPAVVKMVSAFGEYEHGTADVEDAFRNTPGWDLSDIDDDDERKRICLITYKRVLEDMILVVANA